MSLVIVGEGEHAEYLHALAGNDPRIKFLGRVSDEELVDLYSRALAIPFIPEREDYGYVTLEAFASGRPVLTCTDSGEPAQIVRNYETGLVVAPTPEDLSAALEWFWDNRRQARNMGLKGLAQVREMSWADTACALAEAAMDGVPDPAQAPLKVAVLDMQPIDPPTGGTAALVGAVSRLGRANAGQLCWHL
jgi:glycosyltransferase involved in cell wall biosynthesis